MDLDQLVAVVAEKINDLIQKPKMTDKLLKKPPFRFLHDTISALTVTTGFGEGLYSEAELDCGTIADKQAKILYLEKIFSLVGICKGTQFEVKGAKVVAGQEPEQTNAFLLALAECAADSRYDNAEAVRRALSGEVPGTGPIPLRQAASKSEAKESSGGGGGGAKQSMEATTKPSYDAKSNEIREDQPANVAAGGSERGKSRGGTRGGKPNQATVDTGLSRMSSAPNLDAFIEKCDGSDATTQLLVGDLIAKPKCTEKLLAKPPFRFIFDIVLEIIKATGFANNLYTPAEMDSANVTEKNQKIQFLEKITRLVGIQLNTLVEAKPSRIIAGLDPQITNNFLQLLAVAARHVPDSSNAVRTVLEQMGGGGGGGEAPVQVTAPAPAQQQERVVYSGEKASDDKPKTSRQPAPMQSEPKDEPPARASAGVTEDDKQALGDEGGMEDGETKRSMRPTTARRCPPKVKDGATVLAAKDVAPTANKKASGIMMDGQVDDDDDEVIAEDKRLGDEVSGRTGAAAGAGADGGAQSKLVKDILSRQAEQEAARAPAQATATANTSSASAGDAKDAKPDASEDSKGVGGIRIGKLRKTGTDKKGGAANGSSSSSGGSAGTSLGATLGEGDLERMRGAVQVLVQHTGPLGTCMDYIQEDVGLMTAELHRWEEECRKYEGEVDSERKKSQEILKPLKVELSDLEDQISEHISKITSLKASIAKNDERIQSTLRLVSSA